MKAFSQCGRKVRHHIFVLLHKGLLFIYVGRNGCCLEYNLI
jgi:hypothetical protein